MRIAVGTLLALLAFAVWANERNKGVFETFTADNTDPGLCDVVLIDGVADFYLSGDFGSGTASLQQWFETAGGGWSTIKSYTADPDPKSQTITAGQGARFRVILSGSSSPDLDCNIND